MWFQDHRNDSSKGKKNKIYEHLKKEIEVRAKRVVTKEDVKNQVFFIDKARNAGNDTVNIGHGSHYLNGLNGLVTTYIYFPMSVMFLIFRQNADNKL